MTSSIYQPLLNLKIPGIYNLTISKDKYKKIIPFMKFQTTSMKDFIKNFDKYLYGRLYYSGHLSSNNHSYKDYLKIFSKSSSYFERGISGNYKNNDFSSRSFISYLDYMFNRDFNLILSDTKLNFNTHYFIDYIKEININSRILSRSIPNTSKIISFSNNILSNNFEDIIKIINNINNYNLFNSKLKIKDFNVSNFENYQYIFNPKIVESNPYNYNIDKYQNTIIQDKYPRIYKTFGFHDFIKSIDYIEEFRIKFNKSNNLNILNINTNRFELLIQNLNDIHNKTSIKKFNRIIIASINFKEYLNNFTQTPRKNLITSITLAKTNGIRKIYDKYKTFNFYINNINNIRLAKLEISKKEISKIEQNNIFENSFIEYSKYNKYYKELKLKINIKKFKTDKFQDLIKNLKRNYNINPIKSSELKYKIVFTGLNYNNKISKSFLKYYKSFTDALTKLKGKYTSIKLQNEYGRFELFMNTLNPLEKTSRTWYLNLAKYQIAKKEITIKELSKLEQNTFSYKDFIKDFNLLKSNNSFNYLTEDNIINFRSKRYEHYIKYLFSINSFNSVDSAAIYEKVT